MFWQFGFHFPYSQSVSKSPVGVRTVKHLFSPWKSVCYSLGRLSQGISCWNEYSWWKVFNPQFFFLQGSGFEFLSEVWLSRRQSALFETSFAIFSRHVVFGKLVSPMKTEERCSIPVSVWFSYIRIMFLLSEVRTGNRFGFRSCFYLSWIDLSGWSLAQCC